MKKIYNQLCKCALGIVLLGSLATSCNKGFEDVPSTSSVATGQNLAEKLSADPNYSIFVGALQKYGLWDRLANQGAFTVLALDNPTMTVVLGNFGLTPASFAALGPGQPAMLAPVFLYHVIPQKMPAAALPSSYSAATAQYPAQIPNAQLPSSLNIGTLPTPPLPIMMNTFLAKNGPAAFANNIPIMAPDAIVASNGVVHRLAGPTVPPSSTIKSLIASNGLTYLAAAIVRADSGQVGLNRLDSVANFALANITVNAPTNAAFQTLLTGAIAQALIAQGMMPATALATATTLASTPAVFSNPLLYSALTAQTVRGIVVYHLFGNRTFSTNLPLSTGLVKTLLNSGIPAHPGVTVDRSTAAPRLLGLGNMGQFANFTTTNIHGINGVMHIIDRVLLPQ
jgi:uncharacterized surface protein with fasciclin (FAS1) repeats